MWLSKQHGLGLGGSGNAVVQSQYNDEHKVRQLKFKQM
jgi:hypothetical protein